MVKRFSRLRYALKAIQDPNSDDARNEPPSGSVLDKYQEFTSGSAGVSYPRSTESKQKGIAIVGVNPFGLALNSSNVVRTSMSQRVVDEDAISTLRTAANIETNQANLQLDLTGFVPAKAVVFIEDVDGATTQATSQITGIRYAKRSGASYTIPYGQATGETVETEVRANITGAITNTETTSISFKSEKL